MTYGHFGTPDVARIDSSSVLPVSSIAIPCFSANALPHSKQVPDLR